MREYIIYYDTDQTVNHSWVTVDRTESGAMEQFYHEIIESEGPNGHDRDDIHITGIVEGPCIICYEEDEYLEAEYD